MSLLELRYDARLMLRIGLEGGKVVLPFITSSLVLIRFSLRRLPICKHLVFISMVTQISVNQANIFEDLLLSLVSVKLRWCAS